MSLRDQLLKAGLVDKKKVQQARREEKQERRQAQAHREKKAVVEARAQAEAQARAEAERDQRLAARQARQAAREEAERERQVDNLLRHYAIRWRAGNQRFFHRSPCGRYALRLLLPQSLALELRAGRLAVAWHGAEADPELVLLPRATALRIQGLAPARLLFFNVEPPDPDDPSLQLC